jgi:hypothetical protein
MQHDQADQVSMCESFPISGPFDLPHPAGLAYQVSSYQKLDKYALNQLCR